MYVGVVMEKRVKYGVGCNEAVFSGGEGGAGIEYGASVRI